MIINCASLNYQLNHIKVHETSNELKLKLIKPFTKIESRIQKDQIILVIENTTNSPLHHFTCRMLKHDYQYSRKIIEPKQIIEIQYPIRDRIDTFLIHYSFVKNNQINTIYWLYSI